MIKKNSRRSFIKKTSLVASIPLYLPSLYGAPTMGLNDSIGHGDFKFKVNKDWGFKTQIRILWITVTKWLWIPKTGSF